jgi:hypothetical protein
LPLVPLDLLVFTFAADPDRQHCATKLQQQERVIFIQSLAQSTLKPLSAENTLHKKDFGATFACMGTVGKIDPMPD